jgi:hypothetical protein
MPQGPPSQGDERIHRTLGQVNAALVAEGWAPEEQLKKVRKRLLHQLGTRQSHILEEAEAPEISTTSDEARNVAFLGTDAAETYAGSTGFWLELHSWYVWWKLAHDDEFWEMLEREVS